MTQIVFEVVSHEEPAAIGGLGRGGFAHVLSGEGLSPHEAGQDALDLLAACEDGYPRAPGWAELRAELDQLPREAVFDAHRVSIRWRMAKANQAVAAA